jgi:hypothetical protein
MSKSRDVFTWTDLGVQTFDGHPEWTEYMGSYTNYDKDTLLSQGHRNWKKPTIGDNGGAFIHYGKKRTIIPSANTTQDFNTVHYNGRFIAIAPNSWDVPIGDGADWGSQAYDRMKPTKPTFEAMNSIYELRDIPGMLKQRFLSSGLKAVPNWWLALQFGWGALFNDIAKLVKTQQSLEKRLNWLLEHNGKPVKRRVELAKSSDTVEKEWFQDWGYHAPILNSNFYDGPPWQRWKDEITNKVWASARFRYWLPASPEGVVYKKQLIAAIYGIRFPPPIVIWNAMPWTWLSDWFFNTGEILANMDVGVAERLAADYFYVMREQSWKTQLQSDIYLRRPNVKLTSYMNVDSFRQTRLQGDPFGFATQQSDLSGMQLSILGALGLSRL